LVYDISDFSAMLQLYLYMKQTFTLSKFVEIGFTYTYTNSE